MLSVRGDIMAGHAYIVTVLNDVVSYVCTLSKHLPVNERSDPVQSVLSRIRSVVQRKQRAIW